jgi:hypothetical protein
MAFNVNGLSEYVSENKDIILKDIVFGETYGDTIPLMTKQLGIKTSEKIHPTTIDATLQEVNGCGFNADGGLSFSERTITTHQKKVNLEFCLEDLKGKFAEYTLRIGANQDALPFEGEIVEGVAKSINKQVEELVWQDLLSAAGIKEETAANANDYDAIMEAYMKLPEEVLEDGILFVSPAVFRTYVSELVGRNLYHYNPADGDLQEIFIPGASVKVRKAKGLKERVIFGTSPRNMVYGTDFLSNKEEIKVWYSDDADAYRLKARLNAGAQVAFPELVVKLSLQ